MALLYHSCSHLARCSIELQQILLNLVLDVKLFLKTNSHKLLRSLIITECHGQNSEQYCARILGVCQFQIFYVSPKTKE